MTNTTTPKPRFVVKYFRATKNGGETEHFIKLIKGRAYRVESQDEATPMGKFQALSWIEGALRWKGVTNAGGIIV